MKKNRRRPQVRQAATSSWENYVLPGIDLLEEHSLEARTATDPSELQEVQQVLIETLGQFGIAVAPGDITKGPTITRYEVYPAKGVRVDKIVSLERDLARATSAERINILAPIPGKDTVGIELANTRKVTVKLRELFQSTDWDTAQGARKNSARARQGRLRQDNHCRPGADAASACRRDDWQRKERLYQCADCQHALSLHAGRDASRHH